MKKYSIWDKESDIYTPSGKIFTAEEWKNNYPIAKVPNVTIVGGAGIFNGSFFGVLQDMKLMYQNEGCDFSECETDEDILNKIEEFDETRNKENEEIAEATQLAEIINNQRIADALEDLVVLSMPDIEEE